MDKMDSEARARKHREFELECAGFLEELALRIYREEVEVHTINHDFGYDEIYPEDSLVPIRVVHNGKNTLLIGYTEKKHEL